MTDKKVREELLKLQEQQGFTITWLANKADIDVGYLVQIMKGTVQTIGIAARYKLSQATGLDLMRK